MKRNELIIAPPEAMDRVLAVAYDNHELDLLYDHMLILVEAIATRPNDPLARAMLARITKRSNEIIAKLEPGAC